MQLDLATRIYEAAFLPELWPAALQVLGEVADCPDSALFVAYNGQIAKGISAANTAPKLERYVRDGWHMQNEVARRSHAFKEPRFHTLHDLFAEDEMDRYDFLQKFLKPEGLYWCAGTVIRGPFESTTLFTVNRPYNDGPLGNEEVAHLTRLRPELARASLVSARLQFERVRSTVDTLQALGLPAAAISPKGRLTLANSSFQDLIPLTFQDRAHRLQMIDREADSLLRKFVEKGPGKGVSIPLKAALDRGPMLIHVLPIVGNSHDLFMMASWAMVIVPISAPRDAQTSILEGLFDLTPGEARVARALAAGQEVEAAALNFGVSAATVRSQLKAIFAKTGTRRQSDLMAILTATQTLRNSA
jgi:DNA-binding CsgD family transcriptional regulator